MRSVDLYSFYIVYASVKERKGDRYTYRDPANARGVGGFIVVAPQSRLDPRPRLLGPRLVTCAAQTGTRTRAAAAFPRAFGSALSWTLSELSARGPRKKREAFSRAIVLWYTKVAQL